MTASKPPKAGHASAPEEDRRPPSRRPQGKARADALMVERQVAADLAEARALIMRGAVLITDPKGRERKVLTAGEPLPPAVSFRLKSAGRPFVSRAGQKLSFALDHFRVDALGKVAADIGLSTGGFTDCLLQRGATRVHGIDVAYGAVAWKIRQDPRVVLHERTNARHVTLATLGERVDVIVVDVSFVSAARLLPQLATLLTSHGQLVVLVKPQFEAPKGATEGGIVRDPTVREEAVNAVVEAAERLNLMEAGRVESPIKGAEGNIEWLVHLRIEHGSYPPK